MCSYLIIGTTNKRRLNIIQGLSVQRGHACVHSTSRYIQALTTPRDTREYQHLAWGPMFARTWFSHPVLLSITLYTYKYYTVLHTGGAQHISTSYELWLPAWKNHQSQAQPYQMIPPSAMKITTPLVQNSWHLGLQEHPNQQLAQFFLNGISEGFRIGYGSDARSPRS